MGSSLVGFFSMNLRYRSFRPLLIGLANILESQVIRSSFQAGWATGKLLVTAACSATPGHLLSALEKRPEKGLKLSSGLV